MGYLALLTRTDIILPQLIKVYGGDTLWAVMCYFLICFIFPKTAGINNLLLALLLSLSVESSQLYQAEWVKEIRANKFGGLLLGHGFKVSDLVCYGIGNFCGFAIDRVFRKNLVRDKSQLHISP
jgi:glycopeptide antibiotics resistance protein